MEALIPCPELGLILPADFKVLPLEQKAEAILYRWQELNAAYRECRRRHQELVDYAETVAR